MRISTHTGNKRPNPIDTFVGSRVRMRRKIVGLSQEKLGDKLGITFQQIQKYEKGTNRVGASRLQAMAQALDVPINYFFPTADREGGETTAELIVMGFLSTTEGLDLSRSFLRIKSPKVRRKLIDLAKALGEEA